MDILSFFEERAKKEPRTIVFPEGSNSVIAEAALRLQRGKVARPLLLGEAASVKATIASLGGTELDTIDPRSDRRLEEYVADYAREHALPEQVARRIVTEPLGFAAMMVKRGEAAGMVGGINCPTRDLLMVCELIIGLKPGLSVASSFYLMDIPGYRGGEDGLLIFADPAIQPEPGAVELADIAIATAASAAALLGWQPRVAMLSFSTKGSADHPAAEKVAQAVELAKQRAPELLIDGEMQLDAALVESVARQKIHSESAVAGRANILVFPNLDAANIGSKLVQQLAGARSYGPILQGFAAPVSDLSRSATPLDVFNSAVLVAVQSTADD